MKLFVCLGCTDLLRSNLAWPQCSTCGTPAHAIEDRDIMTEQANEDLTPVDAKLGFEEGSVLLWQREGRARFPRQTDTIDRLLAENRHEQLMRLYGASA